VELAVDEEEGTRRAGYPREAAVVPEVLGDPSPNARERVWVHADGGDPVEEKHGSLTVG